MELFGLLLSIPGAFFVSVICRFMILQADPHYPWVRRYFQPFAQAILGLLVVELVALATLGSRRSHDLAGPLFEIVRGVVFFFATPALVGLIVLRWPSKWYVVGPIGMTFAFALILLQFRVSDQVYGEKVERPYRSSYSPATPYSSISRRLDGKANNSHRFVYTRHRGSCRAMVMTDNC